MRNDLQREKVAPGVGRLSFFQPYQLVANCFVFAAPAEPEMIRPRPLDVLHGARYKYIKSSSVFFSFFLNVSSGSLFILE